MKIFVVQWEEKERGWGNRPDGWSLHVSADEYHRYAEQYRNSLPQPLPEEYSVPVESSGLRAVDVPEDHAIARALAASKSLRFQQYDDASYALEKLLGISRSMPK